MKKIGKAFRAVGRGLDKGLTGVENFFHGVQRYFLNYNVNSYFQEIMDGRVLSEPEREQFWRMVSYRDHGRW